MPFVRYWPALAAAAAFLVLATAQRLLLLWLLWGGLATNPRQALEVVARGARLDAACAAVLLLPAVAWCAVLPERAWASRTHRRFATAAFVLVLLAVAAFLTVDTLQFVVHHARIDAPVRERLLVAWGLLAGPDARWGVLAVTALGSIVGGIALAAALWRPFRRAWSQPAEPMVRGRDFILVLGACALAVAVSPRGRAFPAAPVLREIAGSSLPGLASAGIRRLR